MNGSHGGLWRSVESTQRKGKSTDARRKTGFQDKAGSDETTDKTKQIKQNLTRGFRTWQTPSASLIRSGHLPLHPDCLRGNTCMIKLFNICCFEQEVARAVCKHLLTNREPVRKKKKNQLMLHYADDRIEAERPCCLPSLWVSSCGPKGSWMNTESSHMWWRTKKCEFQI